MALLTLPCIFVCKHTKYVTFVVFMHSKRHYKETSVTLCPCYFFCGIEAIIEMTHLAELSSFFDDYVLPQIPWKLFVVLLIFLQEQNLHKLITLKTTYDSLERSHRCCLQLT